MRRILIAAALLLSSPALAENPLKHDRLTESNPECTIEAQFIDASLWEAKQAAAQQGIAAGRKLVESGRQKRLRFEATCIRPLACPMFFVAGETISPDDNNATYHLWKMANDFCNPDFLLPLMNRCFVVAQGADIRLQRERKEQETGGIEAARDWDAAHSLMMKECIRPLTAKCEMVREMIDSDSERAKLNSAKNPYTEWMALINAICVKKSERHW